MKIRVLGSTCVGYSLPKEDAVNFSGKSAGICYLADPIDKLLEEPIEKTERRASNTLKSGHHSVFGHPTYNLVLEEIPKIIAMIINNEKIYNTSERSARYTKLNLEGKEKELYEKWIGIYSEEIKKHYPDFDDKKVLKLAQENARYLTSVFTPYVSMEYTVNLGQLNYIINWAKDYIDSPETDDFTMKVKAALKEFLEAMPDLEIEGLDSRAKGRKFSLFATRTRNEEFGENYSTTYLASFAELAQAQRHRTLSYEMRLTGTNNFYVPPIIRDTPLQTTWLNDMLSLSENYPQGMQVLVNERGTIENFVLKCTERLCGAAQLEIMQQTKETMDKYIKAVKDSPDLYNYLLPYSKGARCTFPGFVCTAPCSFGRKDAMTRII